MRASCILLSLRFAVGKFWHIRVEASFTWGKNCFRRYIVQDGSFKLVYAAGDSLSFFNVKNGEHGHANDSGFAKCCLHPHSEAHLSLLLWVDHAESRSLVKKNCKVSHSFKFSSVCKVFPVGVSFKMMVVVVGRCCVGAADQREISG